MSFIDRLRQRAKTKKKRIVFPEAEDPRILKAAEWLASNNICDIILLESSDTISEISAEHKINIPKTIDILNPEKYSNLGRFTESYFKKRKDKGISRGEARSQIQQPLFFGAAMVESGEADGCVAGSIAATSEVLRAAIRVIGLNKGTTIVSSVFLMVLPEDRVLTYGDCGVVPYPEAEQLADIAIQSSHTHRLLTEQEPVTAMLSFSTKGSAEHQRVELVREALDIARKKEPELLIDGELQFDAAFVPEVARRKAPDSGVAGRANVLIFPNLDAGNIAYKITERLGRASATGPIVQGLAKPMMDLSRGCGWEDIVNAACVAVLMGK